MKEAVICAISEDGKSVMDSKLYEQAMLIAKEENLPVFAHCEDKNLVGKGALNAGKKAKELGVEGITNAVEDIITARDILLSKETGARLHLCAYGKRSKRAGLEGYSGSLPSSFYIDRR